MKKRIFVIRQRRYVYVGVAGPAKGMTGKTKKLFIEDMMILLQATERWRWPRAGSEDDGGWANFFSWPDGFSDVASARFLGRRGPVFILLFVSDVGFGLRVGPTVRTYVVRTYYLVNLLVRTVTVVRITTNVGTERGTVRYGTVPYRTYDVPRTDPTNGTKRSDRRPY